MDSIYCSYDLPIEQIEWLYHELNREIRYPDGMITSLGIIYWGRPEHYPILADAANRLRSLGCTTIGSLLNSILTPLRVSKLPAEVSIHELAVRILRHDLKMWLPRDVILQMIPMDKSLEPSVVQLVNSGIRDQLGLLSRTRTPTSRKKLAETANVHPSTLDRIVRYCDMYRLGSNLSYLRTPIYIDMGLDTWQKWATAKSEDIIARFEKYRNSKTDWGPGVTPFPKEVRNGIEWAKMHLLMYEVEW